MVGRSLSKGKSIAGGRGERTVSEGFAPFGNGSGRDESSLRGGFSSYGSGFGRGDVSVSGGFASAGGGRGIPQAPGLLTGYMELLQANNIPSYYPQFKGMMPNQVPYPPQQPYVAQYFPSHVPSSNLPDKTNIASSSSSLELKDEEEDEEIERDDVIFLPSQAGSHTTVAQCVVKRYAYIREDTVDVLEPSGDCARWITGKFEESLEESFLTWSAVSLEKKNYYFDEFRKGFTWNDSEEADIRFGWNKKACKLYAALTCRIRACSTKPRFLLENVWNCWTEKWNEPKFKKRCALMKANRGRASPHTGGSRSFLNTADLLKLKYKVTIPGHRLFAHNHSKGHDMKTFVSSKAMKVHEDYNREIAVQTKAFEENGTPIDKNAAYLKEASGLTKSGVYGIGDQRIIYYGGYSRSSTARRCNSGRSILSEVNQLHEAIRKETEARKAMEKKWAQMLERFPELLTAPLENTSQDPENVSDGHDNLGLD